MLWCLWEIRGCPKRGDLTPSPSKQLGARGGGVSTTTRLVLWVATDRTKNGYSCLVQDSIVIVLDNTNVTKKEILLLCRTRRPLLWQPCRMQCAVHICCCCGNPAQSNVQYKICCSCCGNPAECNVQCKFFVVVATLQKAMFSANMLLLWQPC